MEEIQIPSCMVCSSKQVCYKKTRNYSDWVCISEICPDHKWLGMSTIKKLLPNYPNLPNFK